MWEDSVAEDLLWEGLAEEASLEQCTLPLWEVVALWEELELVVLWESVTLQLLEVVLLVATGLREDSVVLVLAGLALWEQCTLLLLEEVLSVDTGLQEDSVLDVSELVVLELDVLVVSLVAMG